MFYANLNILELCAFPKRLVGLNAERKTFQSLGISVHIPCLRLQLGNSAESKFDSIQFIIVASLGVEAIYELWSALSK